MLQKLQQLSLFYHAHQNQSIYELLYFSFMVILYS